MYSILYRIYYLKFYKGENPTILNRKYICERVNDNIFVGIKLNLLMVVLTWIPGEGLMFTRKRTRIRRSDASLEIDPPLAKFFIEIQPPTLERLFSYKKPDANSSSSNLKPLMVVLIKVVLHGKRYLTVPIAQVPLSMAASF